MSKREQLLNLAEIILRERGGETMHYKDLVDEMARRGAQVGDPEKAYSRIRVWLSQDAQFCRPISKGFYALREHHSNARDVGARIVRISELGG